MNKGGTEFEGDLYKSCRVVIVAYKRKFEAAGGRAFNRELCGDRSISAEGPGAEQFPVINCQQNAHDDRKSEP